MSSDDDSQNDDHVDIKRLFAPAGFPAGFFFHHSVINRSQRAHVTSLIELHGGVVLDNFVDADTVLVAPGYQESRLLEIGYNACKDVTTKKIYVEKISFIQSCIQHRKFAHRERTIQGMGGASGPRTEFTSEDDDNLAYYLATTVPDAAAGGLQGVNLYKALVDIGDEIPDRYDWVKRHTWQSWQNRYKKKQEYFKKKMAEIQNQNKSAPSKQQLFPFDRRVTKRNQRAYGVKRLPSESGDEHFDVEEEDEYEGSTLAGGNAIGTSPKRKHPSERHSLPLAKSLKKRKIPTNSDYIPRRKQYATPEYEGAMNMNMDGTEVPGSGHDGVYIPDNARFTPRYPSPPHDAGHEPSDFDLGPQLSMHQTPILSAIDLTVHSPEFTDLLDFNDTANPDDDTTASTIVVNPSQLHKQQFPVQPSQLQRKTRSLNLQVANDAPFRNTRARSRSVDHQDLRSGELPGRKRRKLQMAPRQNVLEPLTEAVNNPDEVSDKMTASGTVAADSASFTSIISEERDVERILVPETTNSSTASGQTVGSQSISQQSQTLRSKDTRYDAANEIWADIDPVDILREYDAGVKARWSLTPGLAANSGSDGRAANSYRYSEPRQPVHRLRSQLATTTLKVKTPRAWSRSPTPDSFPLPGTRAHEFKEKVERTEKNTPYRPPAGTRAAKYVSLG